MATISDAAGIAKVHVETWRAAYSGIVADSYLSALSVEKRAAWWERKLIEPLGHISVAVSGESVVGFISGGECRDCDLPGYSEIYAVYVHPRFQQDGIGYRLTTGFVQKTTNPCSLWVLELNTSARAFYERSGFRADRAFKELSIGGVDLKEVRYILQRSGSEQD